MHLTNNSSEIKNNKSRFKSTKRRIVFSDIFLNYQSIEQKFFSSAFFRLFSFLKHKMAWFGRLKHVISDKAENSLICNFFSAFFENLLALPLRSYGIITFFFGMFTLINNIFRFTVSPFSGSGSSLIGIILNAVIIFIISALISVSSKSLGNALAKSRLFSVLLFDILNFEKKNVDVETKSFNNFIFVIAGCFLGLLSAFIQQKYLFLVVLAVIEIYVIFKNPETGIISTILLLPFLDNVFLLLFTSTCCISVFFKVLRNKRVMKFSVTDAFVFLLMLIILISGFNGISHMESLESAIEIIILILFGWIVNNTIKTAVLAEKCVNALVISVSFLSVIGIIISFFDIYNLESKNQLFAIAGGILRSIPFTSDNGYVQLAVLTVPFSLSIYKKSKLQGIISTILCALFVVLSLDFVSWVSLLFVIIIYFSVMSPILCLYLGIVFTVLAAVNFFLPEVFSVISDLVKSITNYQAYITDLSLSNSHGIASVYEFMFSGAGVGENVVGHVFKCLFGFDTATSLEACSLYIQIILQIGLAGLMLWFVVYCLFVSNCLSLYYTDKFCKDTLRFYVISCLASCSVIVLSGFYYPGAMSSNIILGCILVFYLSFSFRKCSEIEFTPEAYDLESYNDIL